MKSIFTLFLNNLILIHKNRDWSPNTIFTVYGLFHSGIVYNLITEALTLLILCDWQHRQVSRRMPACYLDLKRMWTAKTWTEVRPYAKLVTQILILQKAIQNKHHRRRHLPKRQFSCTLKIPEALKIFICKDAFLYSPVENTGLTSLASTLEPCSSFLLHISVKWQPQTCMHNWNGALWLWFVVWCMRWKLWSHSDNVWREVPNSIHHYASASKTAEGNEHRPHDSTVIKDLKTAVYHNLKSRCAYLMCVWEEGRGCPTLK